MSLLATGVRPARADLYDPPANYYATATGTGVTLKSQLHSIIDNHTVRSYDDARSLLQVTDRDLSDPDRIVLAYDRVLLDVSNLGSSIPGWDNGVSWNREHTWPRARGVDSSGPDESDLHQLRPTTNQVNNERGNLNFGGAYGQPFGEVFDKGATVWYPGDADAGMIARQQFYMAVRYDGSDGSTENLELVAGAPNFGGTTMGDLDRMIQWHYLATPDEFERYRNHTVYGYQGNRNPFVDRPELAWSVFVDQNNDSQLTLAGGSGAGGASTVNVDLGRVLVGSPLPAAQNVTLNKTGVAGTYYQVTAAGNAISSVTGPYNAFATGGPGSRTVSIGLAGSTASAGLLSGQVVFDNLDVTTGSGAGRGAQDGNDTVNVTLAVLDHAAPSFDANSILTTLSYDFGAITQGAAAGAYQFDVYNLVSTTDFTAALALDQVVGLGDLSAVTLETPDFSGASALPAGAGRTLTARLDSGAVGEFSATYFLDFSDEDLPGAAGVGVLQLSLTGSVIAAANADFNGDLLVDGADFLVWQRGVGIAAPDGTLATGDANGDEAVNGADLPFWQAQFGSAPTASAPASAIPEPSTTILIAIAGLLLGAHKAVNNRS